METKQVHAVIDQFVRDLGVGGTEPLPATAGLEEAGIDSLSLVDLLFRLEREFGIEIPDEALPRITTVGALTDYVAAARAN